VRTHTEKERKRRGVVQRITMTMPMKKRVVGIIYGQCKKKQMSRNTRQDTHKMRIKPLEKPSIFSF
jgi:hypothetical protein